MPQESRSLPKGRLLLSCCALSPVGGGEVRALPRPSALCAVAAHLFPVAGGEVHQIYELLPPQEGA